MNRWIARLVGLCLLAGGAWAQADVRAEWHVAGSWPSWLETPSDGPAPPPELDLAWCGTIDAEGAAEAEALRAALSPEPPPVSRATLEGTGDRFLRYHGLPGGIVLGLSARMPAETAGARLALDELGRLGLRQDARSGGAFVRAPPIAPGELRALARFVRDGLDGLVDLDSDVSPRLAPALAGGGLGELLVRMDRLPHALVPETRPWKTVIVDREVRAALRGDELAFTADLEVRCYADRAGTGWARRVLVIAAPDAGFIGPRVARDLGGELAPLARIAGWLGFLRWAERADPAGFAELCH